MSGVLDVTIIKPLIESVIGVDLITHDDLNGLERGMKGVSALLSIYAIGTVLLGTNVSKIGTQEALAYTAKTMVVDSSAQLTALGVQKVGEICDLPVAITIILSFISGIVVSTKVDGIEIQWKNVSKTIKPSSGKVDKLKDAGIITESGKYSNLGNMSFEDGKKYSSWSLLRKEGLSYEQVEKIKVTPKGQKPSPETYLSNDYINNHLQTFKESGAVKIMPNEPTGTIGGKGGTFVMSGDELNEIIQYADGDVSKIETILGLDQGYLGKNPVIVSIEDTSSLRIPSGNELGAWPEYWEPGGYTSGGIKEAVVNPAAEGTYTYKHLFE